jgi:CheY-like chemotaxis protein
VRPRHRGRACGLPRRRPRRGDPPLHGKHLLLVDDSHFNREVGAALIEMTAARLTLANNGQEAVEAVRGGHFDLVLLDLQMPVMDGYEAAAIIKAEHPELPVVALTAHAMDDERQRVMAAGMDDMLAKPIDQDKFFRLIARWAGARQSRRVKTPARRRPCRGRARARAGRRGRTRAGPRGAGRTATLRPQPGPVPRQWQPGAPQALHQALHRAQRQRPADIARCVEAGDLEGQAHRAHAQGQRRHRRAGRGAGHRRAARGPAAATAHHPRRRISGHYRPLAAELAQAWERGLDAITHLS